MKTTTEHYEIEIHRNYEWVELGEDEGRTPYTYTDVEDVRHVVRKLEEDQFRVRTVLVSADGLRVTCYL